MDVDAAMIVAAFPGLASPGVALPGSTDTSGGTVSTVEITNTLVRPDGTATVGVKVYASLVSDSPWLPDGKEIVSLATTTTDSSGTWTLDLYPTGDYADTGAYYQIREGSHEWHITVPATGGPYLLHDQLIT